MSYFEYIDQQADLNLTKWLAEKDKLALKLFVLYSTERARLKRRT